MPTHVFAKKTQLLSHLPFTSFKPRVCDQQIPQRARLTYCRWVISLASPCIRRPLRSLSTTGPRKTAWGLSSLLGAQLYNKRGYELLTGLEPMDGTCSALRWAIKGKKNWGKLQGRMMAYEVLACFTEGHLSYW